MRFLYCGPNTDAQQIVGKVYCCILNINGIYTAHKYVYKYVHIYGYIHIYKALLLSYYLEPQNDSLESNISYSFIN